jgi:prophage regulatory protein
MADTDFQTHNSQPNPATPLFAMQQQETACATNAADAPPASCEHHNPIRILRLPEVISRVGLRRASIYQRMMRSDFPKQITLGPRAVGWLESEIDAWLAARVSERRKGGDLTSC